MAQYKGSVVSATAVIDWTDILASSAIADGESGQIVVRCSLATRVAAGVADPVASNTIGTLVPAGNAVVINLDSETAVQSIWVQHPASQVAVIVEVDAGGPAYMINTVTA